DHPGLGRPRRPPALAHRPGPVHGRLVLRTGPAHLGQARPARWPRGGAEHGGGRSAHRRCYAPHQHINGPHGAEAPQVLHFLALILLTHVPRCPSFSLRFSVAATNGCSINTGAWSRKSTPWSPSS